MRIMCLESYRCVYVCVAYKNHLLCPYKEVSGFIEGLIEVRLK